MRTSGVLMHISSLPGSFGIGTMGKNAYSFVDFLKSSGQTYWQILPVCPTSYGDSPYQSFSTFAGNSYFIDPDILCDEGYLLKEEYENMDWGNDPKKVDYKRIYDERNKLFEIVQMHFEKCMPNDYFDFCNENSQWLDDYALFMAIKDYNDGKSIDKWDSKIRKRDKNSLKMWQDKCYKRTEFYKIQQYFFFKQWYKLKKYANNNGIKIIGDLPIYVAADSSDVWSNPNLFCLDNNYRPIEVAGCPPDAFSEDGQLWGNPIYNWKNMRRTKYSWWVKRLEQSLKIYDLVRIDHFRGFDSYYCIKYGEKTAVNGKWRKGPGIRFFKTIEKQLGKLPLIAEDLGFLTESVHKLLEQSGYPGMKILQFAFDSREESDYLPHNYSKNCVVYTGTHDNDTINGWYNTADKKDVAFAKEYLRDDEEKGNWAMMIAALSSVADTCILTMQDIIGLDSGARMNTPSTVGNNWNWRATEEEINEKEAEKLNYYTKLYSRNPKEKSIDEQSGEKH